MKQIPCSHGNLMGQCPTCNAAWSKGVAPILQALQRLIDEEKAASLMPGYQLDWLRPLKSKEDA